MFDGIAEHEGRKTELPGYFFFFFFFLRHCLFFFNSFFLIHFYLMI